MPNYLLPSFAYSLKEVEANAQSFKPIGARLFDSLPWFELLARTTSAQDVQILDNRQTGEHFSALVVQKRQERRFGLSFKSIESLSNYYSMYYNVIGSDQPDDLFSLAAYLGSLGLPVARLGPFPVETGVSKKMLNALSMNGFSVRSSEAFGNWIERTQGRKFEAYFNARPSQTINTYERKKRALEKSHQWSFRLIQEPSPELEASIVDYLKVYDSSWKPRESYPDFIPSLVRLAAAHGLLRLGILDVDGEPAAVQLWLIDGDSSLIYKLAHTPQHERYSVGLLLTVEMMRHAFDQDQVAIIDFGSGDDSYKSHWMSERRSRETLTAYNRRTSLGQLASLKP
jgi:Acetyltransferase (GNAT) domain